MSLPPPPPGPRHGYTFSHALDYIRLNKQANNVWHVMRDMAWHTLREIETRTGYPQASISARLRDFRKREFGRHEIQRERVPGTNGLYRYRLVPNPKVRITSQPDGQPKGQPS